jgi:hypothetical protein
LNLLRKYNYDIVSIDALELAESGFSTYEIDDLAIEPLLFQTGYITIKEYDESSAIYRLGYPNIEVKNAFLQRLLAICSPIRKEFVPAHITKLEKALEAGNVAAFFSSLKVFFANVPYDMQLSHEKYYQTIFYILLTLLGVKVEVEVRTNPGRIDAVVATEKRLYVFEFKLDGTPEAALAQIRKMKYFEKYLTDGRETILVGAAFDKTTRNIERYVVETLEA